MRELPLGITIVIPCLNEAETIARAVKEALAGITASGLAGEVLVADNGSSDGSQKLAENAGARIHSVPRRGYGAALHAGISDARFRFVLFADADLSYPFLETPKLVGPLIAGSAEIVVGSRLRGTIEPGAMPTLNRHLGTPVLSWLIRRIYRIPSSDCNSGMRALLRSKYDELGLMCPGMEYASEMLVRVAEKKWKYAEVPISFRKDQRNRAPHLKRWQDGWRHLRFILGNAPSIWLIAFPLAVALALLALAFGVSLTEFFSPKKPILFHTAFGCIAFAMPFAMFASSQLLVRMAFRQRSERRSARLDLVHLLSDRAVTFYLSMVLYGLALLQLGWLLWDWYRLGFGDLFEIGGVIRIMVLTFLATILFSFDMALGLLKLIPYGNDE